MSHSLNRNMKRYLVIENSSRDIEISRNSFVQYLENNEAHVDCVLYYNLKNIFLNDYDIVFIFRIETLLRLSFKLIVNRPRMKVIITGLGRYRNSFLKYLIYAYLYFLQFLLGRNKCDIIFQNCQDSQEFFGKSRVVLGSGITPSNASVIKNGVNKVVRLAYAGRFLKSKGLIKFLSLSDHPNFHEYEFYLAGRANRDIELSKLYPFLDSSNIHFLGYLNNLCEFYSSIDIFIFPSSYGEGFPRVILDCINNGVPFIVLKSNYTADINLPEDIMSKLVLDKWDLEAVSHSINYIISNYSRLSRELHKIRGDYANVKIFETWLNL